jgi:xanthine dehydrogenase YagS FAD-binding subunit
MLLELPIFEHIDATDVKDAASCLDRYGEKARVIAGATDLLSLMKDRIEGPGLRAPEVLVNVKTIPGLTSITFDEETGLKIGAAVTLNQLATSDLIRRRFNILSQAALQVGTTQLRNVGTVGGNVCQRPRCSYFRHPHFVCFKKGGTRCYAVTGEHRFYHAIMMHGKCVMAHPSDMASALIALKARAVIANPEGERKVSFDAFFSGPNSLGETVLKSGELLTAVEVPDQQNSHQIFLKQRIRHAADFALSSVAAAARMSDGICEEISVVLGGVAPYPHVAAEVEKMIKGRRLEERLISDAAEASVKEARPLPMNGYKVDLTKALVKRALRFVAKDTKGG